VAEVAASSPCIKPRIAKQGLARGELVRMSTEELSKTIIKSRNKEEEKKQEIGAQLRLTKECSRI